jgi:hybrid cluster-associated redox disulfide protein
MEPSEIEDLTVSEILARWPGVLRLFIDRHLLCVGCPIAPFHTLEDVAFEHDVLQDELVAAILAIASATAAPASARHRSARARGGDRP